MARRRKKAKQWGDPIVVLRMPQDLIDQVDDAAYRMDQARSGTIRSLILFAFDMIDQGYGTLPDRE